MINYTSIGFYYFSFLAGVTASFWGQSLERKYLLFIFNVIFHLLFFYFFKLHFLSLVTSVAFNWAAVKTIEKSPHRKTLLSFLVFINLIGFVVIKYSFAQIGYGGWNTSQLSFIGISFFTFRLISFLVDMKREQITSLDLFHYINYLTFFPTFLSGPLDRYENFKNEVELNHSPDSSETVDAVFRFVLGAFKKIVLAGMLHDLSIDSISLESVMKFSPFQILISLYVYTLVLYLDFSGYTDMAIGLARLLGLKAPENFNKPFSAKNIQDFWNRWHMSFMQWLRDYVYYPFQHFLLKKVKMKDLLFSTIISTVLIFLLAGIWHGDKLQYILYGAYHGLAFTVFLIWKKFISDKKRKGFREKYLSGKAFAILSNLLTVHYFIFGLLFFVGKYEVLFR